MAQDFEMDLNELVKIKRSEHIVREHLFLRAHLKTLKSQAKYK